MVENSEKSVHSGRAARDRRTITLNLSVAEGEYFDQLIAGTGKSLSEFLKQTVEISLNIYELRQNGVKIKLVHPDGQEEVVVWLELETLLKKQKLLVKQTGGQDEEIKALSGAAS